MPSLPIDRRRWWQGFEWSRVLVRVGLAVMVAGAVLLWAWHRGAERRAVRDLPEAERRALYQRTLDNLVSTCGAGADDGLSSFCRDQAGLVIDFPECDAECRRLADRYLGPVR